MRRRCPAKLTAVNGRCYGGRVIRHLAFLGFLAGLVPSPAAVQPVFPAEHWESRQPESLGLSKAKLDALREVVGGHGCVVRYGYLA